ncbi:alpha/beta hydrolase [Acholeplasma hippikon]|uniref:Predicted esterase n=1 Tax=Acholeplasma hippikon TaxID=264636 RepID=A0A449BIP8_9MOLU|nr:dienelactone hydrolase family protein [Acholeplasma hippikon]VEU82308.1 Predicted esterase [Acholeplasma hippikon]
MKYYVRNKKSNKTQLLFHGTGGSYRDLISIAEYIDPSSNYIAFEGNELEEGMRRFFKRHAIGKFDIPNLELNTTELDKDIKDIKQMNEFKDTNFVAMGFSNGANILESLFQMYPDSLKNFMLLSPVYVRKDLKFKDLTGLNILIVTSYNDPYTTKKDLELLINDLKDANANVDLYLHDAGHRLTEGALNYAKDWYFRNI